MVASWYSPFWKMAMARSRVEEGSSISLPTRAELGSSTTANARSLLRGFFWAAQVAGPSSGSRMTVTVRIRYKCFIADKCVLYVRSVIMKVKGKAPDFSLPDENGKTVHLKY